MSLSVLNWSACKCWSSVKSRCAKLVRFGLSPILLQANLTHCVCTTETLQGNLAKSEQEVSMLDELLAHTEAVLRAHEGLLDVHPDLKNLLWKISPSD